MRERVRRRQRRHFGQRKEFLSLFFKGQKHDESKSEKKNIPFPVLNVPVVVSSSSSLGDRRLIKHASFSLPFFSSPSFYYDGISYTLQTAKKRIDTCRAAAATSATDTFLRVGENKGTKKEGGCDSTLLDPGPGVAEEKKEKSFHSTSERVSPRWGCDREWCCATTSRGSVPKDKTPPLTHHRPLTHTCNLPLQREKKKRIRVFLWADRNKATTTQQ